VSTTFTATGRRPEQDRVVRRLEAAALNSDRIVIRGSVPDSALCDLLGSWDALIVPSIWLESGPQVIYEAFSVQTPIIGSRRGGIAELVTQGQTGFLFSPGNVAELTGLLERFSNDPSPLRQMRKHIPAVRSTDDVVSDMLQLYVGLRPARDQ
jgi:glycosyltransferase involved in cell wall biosynthesis